MLVRRRRHGRVAVLELSRPDRRNAIGPELADHLQRAALAVGSDGEVSAVVLTGAGPSFCAGADMKERTAGRSGSAAVLDAVRRASWAVHEIPVPVIGAARGHAIGAGLELLAMCDYRVVEEGTRMGIPEVRQGITSGGGLLALSSLVGRGQLARLAFTGETLDAGTALAMGVVDDVVDQGGSREVALSLAERMAESPRAALVAAKIALRSVAEPLGPQQWGFLGVLQRSLEGGPAQQEALERMRGARPGPG